MDYKDLKLNITSEEIEIKKEYEWELKYNGKTISGKAMVRDGWRDFEFGAWINGTSREGLTEEQESEIISFIETNI